MRRAVGTPYADYSAQSTALICAPSWAHFPTHRPPHRAHACARRSRHRVRRVRRGQRPCHPCRPCRPCRPWPRCARRGPHPCQLRAPAAR
eukprot:3150924-Prymnesium_polylepis.2